MSVPPSTLLLFTNHKKDEGFLRHLAHIYSEQCATRVTIMNGHSEPGDCVLVAAGRVFGAYDKRIVRIDGEAQGAHQQLVDQAKNTSLQLLITTPCLESLILVTLTGDNSWSVAAPAACKRHLHENFVDNNRQHLSSEYEPLLRLDMVERARLILPGLDQLVSAIIA